MPKRKQDTSDWRNLPLSDWNSRTFQAFLKDRHVEIYEIPYTVNNYAAQAGMIKRMVEDLGAEVVFRFINACFDEYKPTQRYPGINFPFMYSYMRERVLPSVMSEVKKEERRKEYTEVNDMSSDQLEEWL